MYLPSAKTHRSYVFKGFSSIPQIPMETRKSKMNSDVYTSFSQAWGFIDSDLLFECTYFELTFRKSKT